MTYFPLPDKFHSDPRFVGLSDAAVALYARAASWSADQLTDGVVPTTALAMLSASPELASEELCERRVWRRTRRAFQFADWPSAVSRANVDAKREAWKHKKRKTRSSEHVLSPGDTPGTLAGVSDVSQESHSLKGKRLDSSPNGELNKNTKKINSSPDGSDDFDHFYAVYPRKKAPDDAKKAWRQVLKAGADPSSIIAGARRFADECAAHGTESKFIKYPASWLRAGCWTDEPTPVAQRINGHQPYHNPIDQSEYFKDIK